MASVLLFLAYLAVILLIGFLMSIVSGKLKLPNTLLLILNVLDINLAYEGVKEE